MDPAYRLADPDVGDRAALGARGAQRMVDTHDDRFTYAWYGTPERRTRLRGGAFDAFADHRRRHPGRYLAAALPRLPFADQAFDLALCSHLLFTWATVLDEQWHKDSLVELCRVAKEVRVFPLVLQATGEPVAFLDRLRAELHDTRVDSQVIRVRYEFQVGGNQMLRLRRRP